MTWTAYALDMHYLTMLASIKMHTFFYTFLYLLHQAHIAIFGYSMELIWNCTGILLYLWSKHSWLDCKHRNLQTRSWILINLCIYPFNKIYTTNFTLHRFYNFIYIAEHHLVFFWDELLYRRYKKAKLHRMFQHISDGKFMKMESWPYTVRIF